MENIEKRTSGLGEYIEQEINFFMNYDLELGKISTDEKKYSDDYYINKEIAFFMSL